MSHRILVALTVLACGAWPGFAQNTPNTPNTPASQQAQAKRDPRLLTITGCLMQGSSAGTFLLTKVPDPLVDSVAAAGGGAIPTVTYELSGGQNLSAHLGHKIEVTGRGPLKAETPVKVVDTETKRTTDNGNTTASTEVKEKVAVALRPLSVESFKMVSADCAAR
jgi:hypothetical protein